MRIALAQMSMSESMEDNFSKSLEMIRNASRVGARLIFFPEIQLSPFFPQYESAACPDDGWHDGSYGLPSGSDGTAASQQGENDWQSSRTNDINAQQETDRARGTIDASKYLMSPDSEYIMKMREVCRECGIFASPNFYIAEEPPADRSSDGAGAKEKAEDRLHRYDMSLLISDEGEIIGKQKMVHIAQAENFYEQDYYTPSEEGFQVFDTKLGRIGIVVCFDRHYPESARTEALRGADLILIPTANTTAEPSEMFQWEVKVQAFQNSVNIAMCNRTGNEGNMEFSGESIVADYNGETVALAENGEELLIADIDLEAARETRKRKPYTSLRRTELYE